MARGVLHLCCGALRSNDEIPDQPLMAPRVDHHRDAVHRAGVAAHDASDRSAQQAGVVYAIVQRRARGSDLGKPATPAILMARGARAASRTSSSRRGDGGQQQDHRFAGTMVPRLCVERGAVGTAGELVRGRARQAERDHDGVVWHSDDGTRDGGGQEELGASGAARGGDREGLRAPLSLASSRPRSMAATRRRRPSRHAFCWPCLRPGFANRLAQTHPFGDGGDGDVAITASIALPQRVRWYLGVAGCVTAASKQTHGRA